MQERLDRHLEEPVFEPTPMQEHTLRTDARWLGRRVVELVKAIPLGHLYERKD